MFPSLLVFLLSLSPASAAQKRLAAGHVPPAIAKEKIAPLHRLTGTNEKEAFKILESVGMTAMNDMDAAVAKAVALAKEAA